MHSVPMLRQELRSASFALPGRTGVHGGERGIGYVRISYSYINTRTASAELHGA
jgi:hypothetical protein